MDIRFRKYINTAFILVPMTLIMAFIAVMRNYGLHEGCVTKIIITWLTMFPVAFVCGLIIIPVAKRITNKIKFVQPTETNETVVKI
jgi:hypothetical protein